MLHKLRLLTPGPTPLPESVRLAMARDMIHHRKKDFRELMLRIQEGLRVLFGTEEMVLPLASSGTGAMTAAAHGLFAPGERVLVIQAGKFGERWTEIARMRGLDVTVLDVPWGQAAGPDAVREALDADPGITGVLVQVSETSTGVLHPVRDIAAVTRTRDVLLVCDGISAVGISPCPMDEWGIDCLLTGSQKGLMLPPGLALLALSGRAWARAGVLGCDSFYFNLPAERKKLETGETHFTSPVSLLFGLEESLRLLLKNGLSALYEKQWALTMLTRAGVRALGLEPFARESYTWGLTSVCLPEGVDGKKVLALAEERHGVVMAGGQDRLKGRIVRIGHMGWVDWSDILAGLYALDQSLLEAEGYSGARDYMEQAMAAYRAALQGTAGESVPRVLVRS